MPNRPILWISLPTDTNGPDPYARDPGYCKDPAAWVSACFAMALQLNFNLLIAQPSGYRPTLYKKNPGDYRAGIFRDKAANDRFLIEQGNFPFNCGLYMGRWLTDAVHMDPANQHTQEFMDGTLEPFLAPGSILGVDAMTKEPASSQRLHDACACFGVRYYQEGIPYSKFPGTIPSVGLLSFHLKMDPQLKMRVPAGLDMRLRINGGDIGTGVDQLSPEKYRAAVAQVRANGFGIDVLAWVGNLSTGDWDVLNVMAGMAAAVPPVV